ncbi:MAG: tetratricopeptide repeat protein [Catenulispora sp.]|nr:tetratricopeptide repeat protein [Catenulispora sp.]
MQYNVLGPIGLVHQDHFYGAGTAKEGAVLAILLMERGRAVSPQTLADRLWDEHPPEKYRSSLHAYVSRLRRRLREAGDLEDVITSDLAGYRMDVPVGQVDVHRFDLLVSQAQARAASDPQAARKLFRQAEALWKGEPLAGLPGAWADTIRRVLTDKRRTALLRRIELDLTTGGSADDAVAELTELASGRVDQRAAELLMTALDAAGRPGDALAVYRDVRERLRAETGTDPRPGLRMLHQRLLNGSAAQPAAAVLSVGLAGSPKQPGAVDPATPAPGLVDTLDPDPPHVAGREEDLSALVSAVAADLRPGTRGAVFAIDGLAGIGKTTLAVHAAHLLRSRCPDGALQVNLHTHDPHLPPLDPRQALTQLLEAIGTPWRELGRADTLPALAALWRMRTSGRRLLLVLDDAQDTAQIEALIPASAGTIVLVTSRRRLTGPPGIRQRTLGPLPDAAATEILAHITDRTLPDDDDLARFTRSCGGLALAITVAAGHLRSRPVWTVGDLVARLSTTSRALAEDPLTGPIHTAFAMSYQALSGPLRDLLRYIAAHPGPDIGLPAAAAMSGGDLADTDVRLDVLVDYRLLDHAGPHRYRVHDLLRQYILAQADEEESRDSQRGVDRAIAFYEAATARADHALHPRRRALHYPAASVAQDGVRLDTAEQARTWLDAEQLNLVAVTAWAAQVGRQGRIGLLPHVLAQHLDRRGLWQQALQQIELLLAAPESAWSDQGSETVRARLLTDRAGLFIRTDELDRALQAAHAALAIWDAYGDRYGQADALFQIGRAHCVAEHHDQAVQAFSTAAVLYESLGDLSRVAVTEDQWAVATFQQGHHDQAFAYANQALDVARRENDLAVICDVLINLGEMHRRVGAHREALACFQEAHTLSATLGDPLITAVLGNNIGAVYEHAGDHQRALVSCKAALNQFRALGDHRSEIDSLILLASAHTHLADHRAAFEDLRLATELAQRAHDQRRQFQAHFAAGSTHFAVGDTPRAIAAYSRALGIARQAAALLEQTQAHRALSELFTRLSKLGLAQEHRQQAEAIDRRIG